MGVTKLTDMICDGARVYASKIQNILERNCYYDYNESQFDVTDRMCITLNNIEHVRMFLSELPQRLNWEAVTSSLSLKHENPMVGERALSTLHRLTQNAHTDVLQMSAKILKCVGEKMCVEVRGRMEEFLVTRPDSVSATDRVISYLTTNLDVLRDRLSDTIYPLMATQIWTLVIDLFDSHLLVGKPPEYYQNQKIHLRALIQFFLDCWPEGTPITQDTPTIQDTPIPRDTPISQDTPIISQDTPTTKDTPIPEDPPITQYTPIPQDTPCAQMLMERLELNSTPTEQLILDYYLHLSGHMATPLDYLGHLALKVAYREETGSVVTVYLNVIQGIDLPGLDSSGLSDPYVVVSVQPEVLLGQTERRTRTVDQTLQPAFNSSFVFPNIPSHLVSRPGVVLLLTVMDKDVVTPDDFAGEVVISLDHVTRLGVNESLDQCPVVMMPLHRPTLDTGGPFQVLEERSPWDKTAKSFTRARRRFIENQPERTDTVKDKLSSFFKFWSK
ncbi:BAI1-associated protein 3, partial [Aplysia californica]|uniref:BAI1-associated protein 3 n=1 Tax=Aplysia californica TaxID=6500 RepID=A0ABM1A019_APLCA